MMRQKWTVALVAALIASLAGFASPAQAQWTAVPIYFEFADPGDHDAQNDGDWSGEETSNNTRGVWAKCEANAPAVSFGFATYQVYRQYTKVGSPDDKTITVEYGASGNFVITPGGGQEDSASVETQSQAYPNAGQFPGAVTAGDNKTGHHPNGTINNGYGPGTTTKNKTLTQSILLHAVIFARTDSTTQGLDTAIVNAAATFTFPDP